MPTEMEAMIPYSLNATHVEYSKQGLQALLDSKNLNRRDERYIRNVMASPRRLARFTSYAATAMDTAHEAAGYAASEFQAFIDIVQNWVNFFINNQEQIMSIVKMFISIISMFLILQILIVIGAMTAMVAPTYAQDCPNCPKPVSKTVVVQAKPTATYSRSVTVQRRGRFLRLFRR